MGSPVSHLQFNGLLDLIEREGPTLARRAEGVLRNLADTLENNIRDAHRMLASLKEAQDDRGPAQRVVLAEARLTALRHEANAAYRAAPVPWRWFTRGISPNLRHRLQAAEAELSASRTAWQALQESRKRLPSRPAWPPLDTEANACAFLARAEQARVVLHQAMLPGERQAERDRIEKDRALAAAFEQKTREVADSIKKQLPRNHACPYCQGPLGDTPHADHIHPVSRGGMSTKDNMVYACSTCNGRKHDLTLREFAEKYRLDRNAIERRLLALGKRV
ncbi:HNH endonuclease [Deinococcus carri]|uniref:HNH endonuclease n=1 Tax=Deinococcus carri TaxID=1211323 RepID=UPI0031EE59AB